MEKMDQRIGIVVLSVCKPVYFLSALSLSPVIIGNKNERIVICENVFVRMLSKDESVNEKSGIPKNAALVIGENYRNWGVISLCDAASGTVYPGQRIPAPGCWVRGPLP